MGKAGNMSYCKNPQNLRLGDSSMDDGGDGAGGGGLGTTTCNKVGALKSV